MEVETIRAAAFGHSPLAPRSTFWFAVFWPGAPFSPWLFGIEARHATKPDDF